MKMIGFYTCPTDSQVTISEHITRKALQLASVDFEFGLIAWISLEEATDRDSFPPNEVQYIAI